MALGLAVSALGWVKSLSLVVSGLAWWADVITGHSDACCRQRFEWSLLQMGTCEYLTELVILFPMTYLQNPAQIPPTHPSAPQVTCLAGRSPSQQFPGVRLCAAALTSHVLVNALCFLP